jgi:hypothetical protein
MIILHLNYVCFNATTHKIQDCQKIVMSCNLKTTRYSLESYDCTLYQGLNFCMKIIIIVHLATLHSRVHKVPASQGHVRVLFSLSLRKVTVTNQHSLYTNPKQGFRFRKGARFLFPKGGTNTKMRNTKPGYIMHYLNRNSAGTAKNQHKKREFLRSQNLKTGLYCKLQHMSNQILIDH